ncbi:DUF3644 domain-containing protein [Methanococcus maripaludis]|uniref:DUF3644 domain-containing protein n=1 Tax=Methanococcus maripaludis TaxID=39152 RepID=A0A8T3W4P8_METMI|nr:DUF3644 domain-containing protein [Methanococcus maripaludis]MBG0768310.1 DUF3644 domain-containing protein [Methanococcus maripaludis]
MRLREGKTKNILKSSIESALLAVEIYNRPRAPFKIENYISLMTMAWMRLFHAYFNKKIGEKYYYKEKNGKYKLHDGEKKAWELGTCLKEFKKLKNNGLKPPVEENIKLFIGLRNKIEHRHIDKDEIGIHIFGECQALLYNYEDMLVKLFGEGYALNESLAFSLQFSKAKNAELDEANKKMISSNSKELLEYILNYRNKVSQEIYDSQEFSIKLMQIPRIANSDRADAAIQFVKWDALSEEDKKNYEQVVALVKEKVVRAEAINVGSLKPKMVVDQINDEFGPDTFNMHDLICLYTIFKIRPKNKDQESLEIINTNTKYCHYDELHKDYIYKESWLNFIKNLIKNNKLLKKDWKEKYRTNETLDISKYE